MKEQPYDKNQGLKTNFLSYLSLPVTVAVDAVVYYRINNPMMSVTNVDDCTHATRLLAQTTLRNILGTHDLASILSEREEISNAMQVLLFQH